MEIFLAILPVFAVMVLGHLLFRIGVPKSEFWAHADKLVYWVLIPALLFNMTSLADFSGNRAVAFTIILLTAYFGVATTMYVTCRIFSVPSPVTSSVLQGALRHNAWIALAVCEGLYGRAGLESATLAMSILALATNVSIVPILIGLLPKRPDMSVGQRMLKDTVRNPIILSILVGLLINTVTDGPIPGVHAFTGIIGNAALPLMLLCVGAGLSFSGARGKIFSLLLSAFGKLAVFPALVLFLALALELSGADVIVLLVFGATATASAGLNLARQLNGDVPLMSAIIAFQTTALFLSLPATIFLAQVLMTS